MKCKWAVLVSPVLAAALLCGCVPVQVMGSMMDLGSFVVSVQQILEEGTVEDLPAESRSSVSMERLTYTAGGSISNVEVEEKDASVQLRTGPVDRVTVEYSQPAGSQLYTFAERGGTLIVKKERETKAGRHSEEQPTVITLPENTYGSIRVETENGSVQAGGLEARTFSADTVNGSVEAVGVTARNMDLESENGSFRLSGVKASRLEVQGVNGSVALDSAEAEAFTCRLTNGSITGSLAGREEDYSITASAGFGRNNLTSARRSGAEKSLDLRVENGGIQVRFLG